LLVLLVLLFQEQSSAYNTMLQLKDNLNGGTSSTSIILAPICAGPNQQEKFGKYQSFKRTRI
jgi:hypothetical protein